MEKKLFVSMCFWAIMMAVGASKEWFGLGQWMRSLSEPWQLMTFAIYFVVYVGIWFVLAFCPVIYWEERRNKE